MQAANLDPDPEKNPSKFYWRKGPPEGTATSRTHLTLNKKRGLCGTYIPRDAIWDSDEGGRLCLNCKDKWVKMWYFNYSEEDYAKWKPLFCNMGGGGKLQLTPREKHRFPEVAKEVEEMNELYGDE